MHNPLLDSILGQTTAVSVLQNALENGNLSGAYLFVGPNGVGKSTAARQFAKAICGASSEASLVAEQIERSISPDYREIEPVGAGRMINIAQLWPREHKVHRPDDAMLRDLHFPPISSPKRVFVIRDAEGLNDFSGNSLLKTLEEPPPYAHFILTASSPASVLPTIISRCQVIQFGLVSKQIIQQALVEKFEISHSQAHFLSQYSEGHFGQAIELAQSPSLLAGREKLLDFAHELTEASQGKALKLSEEFRKLAPKIRPSDKDSEKDKSAGEAEDKSARGAILRALDFLALYYRDLLVGRLFPNDSEKVANQDRIREIILAAEKYNPEQLQQAIALLLALRQAVERNANIQLTIDVLFLRLTSLRSSNFV